MPVEVKPGFQVKAENAAEDKGCAAFSCGLLSSQACAPDDVVNPRGGAVERRFAVYRNNVIVSLREAIKDTFPAILSLLGEEYFDALAPEFIRLHPPKSPVLLEYGAQFPSFLGRFPPLAAYPYLEDVARLEWIWLKAYHAQDARPLNAEALGTVAADALADLRISPHPSAYVMSSPYPILRLFLDNRAKRESVVAASDCGAERHVLVTRPGAEVKLREIAPGAAALFCAFAQGSKFGAAAEQAAGKAQGFDLGASLAELFEMEAFADFKV